MFFPSINIIILILVFLEVYDFKGLAIVSAIMGFLKTLVFLPTPLVLAEYLSKRRYIPIIKYYHITFVRNQIMIDFLLYVIYRFTSGYGLYLFIQGVLSFLLSPLIGWVRDITQSYIICFHTLSFILALCAIPWIIELVWFHFYPRKFFTSAEKLNQLDTAE